jgi:hypothetical protein
MICIETLFCIVVVAATFWPILLFNFIDSADRKWYKLAIQRAYIPPGVLVLIWMVIYCFIAAANCLYLVDNDLLGHADAIFNAVMALGFVNITLNHLTHVILWKYHSPVFAAIASAFACFTAWAIFGLLVSHGLLAAYLVYLVYPLWTIVATVLHCIWAWDARDDAYQFLDTMYASFIPKAKTSARPSHHSY